MSTQPPDAQSRWRCHRCGNLTRFDVVRTVRTRDFVHVGLDGEPTVEEREVLSESIERVVCRWCQGADTIGVIPRPPS